MSAADILGRRHTQLIPRDPMATTSLTTAELRDLESLQGIVADAIAMDVLPETKPG